jgi:ABC-type antimicrobial peptide transport system permease subunit
MVLAAEYATVERMTRKQEIWVRIALGATRSRIYALTFAEAGVPVFAGVIAGLAANVFASRAIRNFLYGTQVVDPNGHPECHRTILARRRSRRISPRAKCGFGRSDGSPALR